MDAANIRPNLINTPFAFYLPSVLGVGLKGSFFIFIFTQFYRKLPKELEEAAWIDGAGPWKTFLKIAVPNSVSTALGIDKAMGNALSVPILLAGCLLFIVPLIAFYAIIQKKFIASVTNSGIVG